MYVMATAGHVDHGKSTLVRALTGTEPDRWEEERRRGLTIDLGFAAMTLPSGRVLSFVDVPGHERFLGNMLAGLGPAPMVCFVVAADQGWQAQSSDHRDAVAALGIDSGLIVITRTDRAPGRAPEVLEQARRELAGTGLEAAPAVAVSAAQGSGLTELRETLDSVLAHAPRPAPDTPVRMWVDRAFSLRGAGTVVTGTLAAGSLHQEQRLQLLGAAVDETVSVRGLQARHHEVETLEAVDRAAVNLRGAPTERLARGDMLLTPGAWHLTTVIDVRHSTGESFEDAPQSLTVHLGTAAVPARCRRFDNLHARLTLDRPLPARIGDRVLLQGSSSRPVRAGALVLDVEPPQLHRRGAGRRRAEALANMPPDGDLLGEVTRRTAVKEDALIRMGLEVPTELGPEVERVGSWLVDANQMQHWAGRLRAAVEQHLDQDPLSAGLSAGAAADRLSLPDRALLSPLVSQAGLLHSAGLITSPRFRLSMGPAEASVVDLENQLAAAPFLAPEAQRLTELGLTERELAAAERQDRILRLAGGVILLPSAPARAMGVLSRLDQPFTMSAARQALSTSRRVAVPLLEHLDSRGWTRRVDAALREVVR
ncbi:selenocysteine-specific translation elongation factor [Nesterenkonia natronophila]|uniref:Selenocysteine-specific translation elongation factor n=1 Tax=Nesterenkonia natronophila TaxID=2174932 RepID=A0A3A4F4Q9_9MICC|nr:selenocysteine-specific translation elongation factor [Nesterenkonia natronophila]RJN31460.1 selenocysteine-specific translation elongation factor [Nesterenkonia natronophila]